MHSFDDMANPKTKRDRGAGVRAIKLSPNEETLAIAYADKSIDFYE